MRLDVYLVTKSFCDSRSRAAELIKNGFVKVNGKKELKASKDVDGCVVELLGDLKYVSRAGQKLEAALEEFKIDVKGLFCLDIGASTGGFTQCLLSRGADFVYALDVGRSQLHESLRNDLRVCDMPGINARNVTKELFEKKIDIVTMDVSFISQTLLYGTVASVLDANGVFISLVKPQFEAGRENIGKGGIVRESDKLYDDIFKRLSKAALDNGLKMVKTIESPIKGGDGNREFLACFYPSEESGLDKSDESSTYR